MSDGTPQTEAVEELQQFGLREYEAKCFVSLTKITSGTARDVSEHIDIPRTRVYEAVRSLESDGLVEIQHSSPQQFKALPVDEAIEILTDRYRRRIESVEQSLRAVKQTTSGGEKDSESEVWSIMGTDTITTRVKHMVDDAETEVLFLVGDSRGFSSDLYERVSTVGERLDVVIGAGPESLHRQLSAELPEGAVFPASLDWLEAEDHPDFSIGRLVLVDDERLLASTFLEGETPSERAVCGSGCCNGLISILRQLLSEHL